VEINSDIRRERDAANAAQSKVKAAAGEIIVGDFDRFIAEFEESKTRNVAEAARLQSFFDAYVNLAHSTPNGDKKRGVLVRIAGMSGKIRDALGVPEFASAQVEPFAKSGA
jgi:hypothetical protein